MRGVGPSSASYRLSADMACGAYSTPTYTDTCSPSRRGLSDAMCERLRHTMTSLSQRTTVSNRTMGGACGSSDAGSNELVESVQCKELAMGILCASTRQGTNERGNILAHVE